uniref:Uncharacterized protein n=1 Tax=Setaria italica TaxID=4555 RepID=K3YNZ4_SETIT
MVGTRRWVWTWDLWRSYTATVQSPVRMAPSSLFYGTQC